MKESGKMSEFLVVVYGKDGCPRCDKLKRDVQEVLSESDHGHRFAMNYENLSTIQGMRAYALAETVNGQRIPALQVMKYSAAREAYEKIPQVGKIMGKEGTSCKNQPFYLQLETDYSAHDPSIGRNEIGELLSRAMTFS